MFFRLVDHILNKLRPIGSPTFDGSIFKSLLVGFILGVNQIIKIVLLKRNRVGFSILHNRDVIDGEIGVEANEKGDIAIRVRPFRAVNPRGRGIDGHWIKGLEVLVFVFLQFNFITESRVVPKNLLQTILFALRTVLLDYRLSQNVG